MKKVILLSATLTLMVPAFLIRAKPAPTKEQGRKAYQDKQKAINAKQSRQGTSNSC